MYRQCIYKFINVSLSLVMVYTCIYILCTCTDSVHTCICFFILVIYMFQHVYTLYIQIQRYSYMVYTGSNVYIQFFHKIKKKYNFRTWTNDLMHTSKLSWPLCYQHACNRSKICCISKMFTWRLVTHVWRWTSSASQPGHDVSSASTRIALKPRPPGVRPRATRRPHWPCCRADDSARRQVD